MHIDQGDIPEELFEEELEQVVPRRKTRSTRDEESKGPSFMVELLRGDYSPIWYTIAAGLAIAAFAYFNTH